MKKAMYLVLGAMLAGGCISTRETRTEPMAESFFQDYTQNIDYIIGDMKNSVDLYFELKEDGPNHELDEIRDRITRLRLELITEFGNHTKKESYESMSVEQLVGFYRRARQAAEIVVDYHKKEGINMWCGSLLLDQTNEFYYAIQEKKKK